MLVKNKILKEWYSSFGKSKNKEYYNNYLDKLNINSYSSFNEFFEKNFESNKIYLLEFLFPQIQSKNIVSKPLIETTFNDENYRNGTFGIIYNGQITDFNRITSFTVEEYGIFEDKISNHYDDIYLTNQINMSSFQLHLNKFNILNGEFSLIGNFNGDYMDYEVLDFNGLNFHAKIKCIGLLKDNNYPAWIEYLIDSILNYQNKDYKMSILNSFSAFENFITVIHDKFIFEYLAHKSSKKDNDLKDLKKFAQNKKRLFSKAEDVIDFLQISELKNNLKKIETYEKERHRIAHGTVKNNNLVSINFQDMVYQIVSFILSVSINQNINVPSWKKIIKKI